MAPSDGMTDNRSQRDDWDLDPLDANHPMQKIRRGDAVPSGIREKLYQEMVTEGPKPKTGHEVFKPMTADNVVQPSHYSRFKIQPLDFVLANDLGYVEGNVIKYVCRWKFKNGIEDLKKAHEFLTKYIARLEAAEQNTPMTAPGS